MLLSAANNTLDDAAIIITEDTSEEVLAITMANAENLARQLVFGLYESDDVILCEYELTDGQSRQWKFDRSSAIEFLYDLARATGEVAAIRAMLKVTTDDLEFSHDARNAFIALVRSSIQQNAEERELRDVLSTFTTNIC